MRRKKENKVKCHNIHPAIDTSQYSTSTCYLTWKQHQGICLTESAGLKGDDCSNNPKKDKVEHLSSSISLAELMCKCLKISPKGKYAGLNV